MQLKGALALSQNRVPLQKSPSSLAAQSLSCSQAQVLVEATHLPPLQALPAVQGLPSTQPCPSLTGTTWHAPVLGLQALLLQPVLSTVGQLTTLAGLNSHAAGVLPSLQNRVPLQRLPSS